MTNYDRLLSIGGWVMWLGLVVALVSAAVAIRQLLAKAPPGPKAGLVLQWPRIGVCFGCTLSLVGIVMMAVSAPKSYPLPVRVQVTGSRSRVSLGSLKEAAPGRELDLEVTGLNTVPNPLGRWTVCAGLPSLAFGDPGGEWQRFGESHNHNEELAARALHDRDPGDYQTYIYHLAVTETPGPQPIQLPPLYLRAVQPGEHRIGLCVARGTARSRTDFAHYRSGAVIVCPEG